MALAPLVYNLSIGLAPISSHLNLGFYALAGGCFGAFLHFLVQVPSILQSSLPLPIMFAEAYKGYKRFYTTFFTPNFFGMSAVQIDFWWIPFLASLISVGALSVYMYALNLESFPYGVVAISFSVAVFSTLAEKRFRKIERNLLSP